MIQGPLSMLVLSPSNNYTNKELIKSSGVARAASFGGGESKTRGWQGGTGWRHGERVEKWGFRRQPRGQQGVSTQEKLPIVLSSKN